MKNSFIKIFISIVIIIFISTGCGLFRSTLKPTPPVNKQYFNESDNLRYSCNTSGIYKIELIKVTMGNVSTWTPCFEGNPIPQIKNRCNENFNIKDWEVNLNKNDQLTIWKTNNGSNSSSETMIVSGPQIKNNILEWRSDDGFTVELKVSRVEEH